MTLNKNTLYWSVYKNLEREVIELSRQIHFDDNQLSVYSVKIAELLIRCSIEIESIAKELYYQNGGITPLDDGNERDLYFDTDCIELLENKWELSEKKVFVSASTFYFDKEEHQILTPLKKANKRGKSGSDWKKAYQAVKHNRSQNLSKGNIENLIKAMGALYLLNIYYRNDHFNLGIESRKEKFDYSLGSEVFSIKSDYVAFNDISGDIDMSMNYKECVYIEKYTDDAYQGIVLSSRNDWEKQKKALIESTEFKDFISKNPNYSFKSNQFITVCREIGGDEFMRKMHQIKNDSIRLYINSPKEVILNKNTKVYPDIKNV
ncbi:hypothetical protein EZS27_012616 [termite gut metagenome]|jgi:hypothetical protein|uniref:Uncharacterized protein n=1 Tax=termite gut metagenome TaxID=433724 RepID=A0A5J4S1Y5_9ZZZZ